MNVVPLHLMQAGQAGPIVDLGNHDPMMNRLNEIGIAIGETLKMIQPGSPCIVAIGHQRLSIRGDQCDSILVQIQ